MFQAKSHSAAYPPPAWILTTKRERHKEHKDFYSDLCVLCVFVVFSLLYLLGFILIPFAENQGCISTTRRPALTAGSASTNAFASSMLATRKTNIPRRFPSSMNGPARI